MKKGALSIFLLGLCSFCGAASNSFYEDFERQVVADLKSKVWPGDAFCLQYALELICHSELKPENLLDQTLQQKSVGCTSGIREVVSIAHEQQVQRYRDAAWQMLKNEHGIDDWQEREAASACAEISRNHIRAYCRHLALECISQGLRYDSHLAREVRDALENDNDEKMNSKQISLLIESSKKQISRNAQKQVAAILAMAR